MKSNSTILNTYYNMMGEKKGTPKVLKPLSEMSKAFQSGGVASKQMTESHN